MSCANAALSAKNLDVSIPGRTLVRQLDVEFSTGEFVAVLGQNGAGKTLTLHTLAGLRPAPGELHLFGADLRTLPRRAIARRLALLPPTSEALFPATVFDTALIGRHPHVKPLGLQSDEDYDIARNCLREMSLGSFADRDVATLSGGERRRLAIAQTLAQTPQVFLLDEPLNHLDPQHQLDVLELFARQARDGATVVATLHDVNLAIRFADRCLLLFGDGRWEVGEAAEILTAERLSQLYDVQVETVDWRGFPVFVTAGSARSDASGGQDRADPRSVDKTA